MKAFWLIPLVALVACGNGGDDDPIDSDTDTDTTNPNTGGTITVPDVTGDPETIPLNGECPLADRYGGFVISNFDFYAIVDGSVADGVVPVTILEEVAATAECKLLKRNNPFCDPPCQATETCDFDGSCIPFPLGQDIGYATVGGLAKEVIMQPVIPGYTYFDTALPFPAFEAGDLIELRTSGGVYDPVELHGVGVDTLVLTEDTWILFENDDMVFNWTPPAGPVVRSKIHIRLNIDQHGNTPIQLFCEFEDDGSAALPSSLVSQLINAGVTGFPNATVSRRTVDSTPVGDGCMDFVISSPVQPSIRVDGHVPCTSDFDCPDGQTCNLLIQTCE